EGGERITDHAANNGGNKGFKRQYESAVVIDSGHWRNEYSDNSGQECGYKVCHSGCEGRTNTDQPRPSGVRSRGVQHLTYSCALQHHVENQGQTYRYRYSKGGVVINDQAGR